MKKNLYVVLLSCVALVAAAQDRYIVAPRGEVVPIPQGESALKAAERLALVEKNSVVQSVCPTGAIVGLPGPGNVNFGFGKGDVCLQQLIAPVSGVIESVYFRGYASFGGSCSIRIFQGRPLGCGGYYPSGDSCGYHPYKDDPGVDTNFVPRCPGGQDPNGPEMWGLGGYIVPGVPQGIAMLELGYEPAVTAGQAFNVCLRLLCYRIEDRVELLAVSSDPGSMMKFYGHPRFPDPNSQGWWRREYTMNVWAVIRATGNVPPTVENVSTAHDTLGSVPVTVRCTAFDCNFLVRADTGVASATLQYNVNGGSYSNVAMTRTGSIWSGVIPAQQLHSTVGYRVTATDNHGLVSTPTAAKSYRLVGLNRDGYITTNNATYSFVDITGAGGGTQIPVSAFFNTSGPNDDGTAGPFDIGGVFSGLFGRSQRYAWVGVNGAICLSNSPTDTVRVGNGYANYNPPSTAAPRNFIGAFWNDFIIGAGGNGSIWYKVSGTQFIVQWNHIGNFNAAADTNTTFEVILDRAANTITFQYKDVGNTTLATDGLIALQDTVSASSRYVYINRFGYPSDTRARNSYAIQLAYSPTGVQQPGGETPLQYSLSANYPNPFNPSTTIRYELPQRSLVTLRVFNVLGQEVATLVNELKFAGTYSVKFSGENLVSSVYFYRIQTGTFSQTKKMVLIR